MRGKDSLSLKPLSQDRHRSWSWQPPCNYNFARGFRSVPITLSEAASAASCFPLVFASGPNGLSLMALLRRSSTGSSAFVGADGRWQAAWLPPRLATWPFDLLGAPGGRHALALHEESPLVLQGPGGLAIFSEEEGAGEIACGLAPELARIAGLLRTHAKELPATATAVAALDRLGLLIPLDGDRDLWILNVEAATTLTEADVLTLHRAGALALLYSGLVSLSHLPWMARAEQRFSQAQPTPAPDRPEILPASSFLTALAMAETSDQNAFHLPLDS